MEIREMRKKNEMSNAYIINMQPYEKAVSKIDVIGIFAPTNFRN